MRRALFLLLLLTLPRVATAQDPNLQRGFAPGKLYDVLGLDSVSTFNGNLNVRIPLGQRYTVGPVLQYQFMLAYNSKIWEFEYLEGQRPPGDPRKRPVPDTRSNAGLGWRLTLGELFPPKSVSFMPPTTGWTYVAPDGSEHEFRTIESDPVLAYTEDSSFLRLRRVSEAGIVYREIDFPDGTIHRFDTNGQLQKITDRYGNWIKVARTDYQWTVTDGYGNAVARSHTIVLEDGVNSAGQPYNQLNFKKRPVQVKLAAFGGTVATYTLTYDDVSLPVGVCAGNAVALPDALVPLLNQIDLPDGTAYVPSYQMQEAERCTSGTLDELTLPTLGKIAWQHGLYSMALQECVKPSEDDYADIGWLTETAGIVSRTLEDRNGNILEKRSYAPELVNRTSEFQKCGGPVAEHYLMRPPEEFRNTITVTVPEGVSQKTIEKTTHYFSMFPAMANPVDTTFAKSVEYGLPLTRRDSNGDRFLSSHTYACSGGNCSATVARTAYLKYGYALGSAPTTGYAKPIDPRVEAQRTVFNGDSCGGLCLYYTDSSSSDYDGYGHYKQTDLTGNLGGPTRTVRTEYVPDSGAWLLNRYTASSVSENSQATQRMTYTFDSAGLERSRRALKGTTAGAGDLLSVSCRDARGFVVSEKFLGGDDRTPPADTAANLCAAVPVAKEFEIVHEYPSGDGFRTWHRARYSGALFNIADETLDSNTGLPSSTRDSAGLTTSYTYDSLARLKTISPPGAASSSLVYRNASSSDPARVTSTVAGSPAIEHTYDFDDVGRLFREKRRMPDGSWALRKTDYRGAATTKFTSEWVALAEGGDENLVTPTIGTTFEHDQFGRLTKVTAPDAKVTSATYVNGGVREVQRTRTVATPSSSDTSVTVTEGYDLHGKLVSVREPAGPTTATAPSGGEVRTDYGYDSGGRLVSVTMNPAESGTAAQQRQFTYDSRGLLISETHPEKELATTYGSFDARGHAWTSTDADVTVSYEYDSAERLFRISNASGSPLKELTFGTASDCTYCNGKLRKAVRHNYLPVLGDHQVTETYTYGANGLPSKRETLVERPGSQIQKFWQDFTYDELLALDRVDYPTCALNGCSTTTTNGLLNVEHTRTRGLLTEVSGFATIEYHSSGMVSEVRRATSPVMTDTYEPDQGMARPSKIKFTGATACTIPNNPVITASSFVCTGSAGNQASLSNPQSGVTYTWTIQNGTPASSTGQSVSFTAGASGQVTLTVTAQNACGTAASAPKTATIPQATVSGSTTIDVGSSVYVDVALTGTPPWSLTWSDGTVSSNITASPFRRQVSPGTTTYQLTAATNASCSLVRTGSATITVRPAAPGWITAQATDRLVQINWQAVSVPGGARYDVERAENVNGPWTAVATATTQGSWVDTAPADPTGARRAYVYRVRTVAPDGMRSPLASSPRDYAVTATAMYPTGGITPGVSVIQGQYIVELRRGIDALRKLVNLPEVFTSQPAPSGWVLATYFTDLLTPLDQARASFGYGAFVYSGVERPRPGLIIKAEYVTQLREVLK